jgi:hypothetical protein
MTASREETCSESAAAATKARTCIGGWWVHDAVGGHQDGPRKLGKVPALAIPGTTIVADQVGVLVQLGVAMARQHLTMCVHIDALHSTQVTKRIRNESSCCWGT